MNWFHRLRLRFRALFQKRELETQMDDEMRSHIEMQTQENIDAGMNPEEARYEQFGWAESIKETCREQRGVSWIENFVQDVRYGARTLRKNPGFTAVAVLTLALGIGANTAIFSVVHAVLLRSLPYDEADRIVQLWTRDTRNVGPQRGSVSLTDFADWKEQNRVFQAMAYFQRASFNLTGVSEPKRIRGAIVSAEFFKVLGTQPIIGRTFFPEEDFPGRRDAVILSHGFWQREFGGRPNLIGQVLQVDGRPLTVIGVMPAEFNFPMQTELWIPFSAPAEEFTQHRHDVFSMAVARLNSGFTRRQAQAEMDGLAQRLAEKYPQTNRDRGVRLVRIRDDLVRDVRPALTLLLAAVGLVLLIACANVANLLLARALTRQREIALRVVLGAGRGRLILQLLTESVLLALLGGVLGFVLAYWIAELLRALAPASIPRMDEVKVDFTVLSFSFGLSLITGVLFGLVPAWYSSGRDFTQSMGAGKRGTGIVTDSFARKALVMSEVGLAALLLISASLLVKSMFHLLKVEPGFDTTTKVVSAVVLRTGTSVAETTRLIRQAVRQVDADLPVGRVNTFEQLVTGSVAEPRFRTFVLASLAVLAVLLAVVGLYGLLAYSVAERTREIGIRMALGARRADVVGLILRQCFALVLGGIVIGLLTATVGTRLMRPLLFEVGTIDFVVFTVIPLFLGIVALLSCSIPAWRASRVDPMEALRCE